MRNFQVNSKGSDSAGNILGLLGVCFVVLKLMGFINWSWWWVTVPFWGGLALFAAVAGVGFVILFLVGLIFNRG